MALLMNRTIRLDLSALSLPSSAQLQNHPLIRAVAGNVSIQERNEIHYDTPDLALRRDNVALTLNRQGEQWIQRCSSKDDHEHCLKWIETPLATNQLDFAVLKTNKKIFPSHALALLQRDSEEVLAPVFTLHCREEQRSLDFPDDVHIVLREERGYLKFGASRQQFHELVLEHQSGNLARWYQTALELAYYFAPHEKIELGLVCTPPIARGFAWLDHSLIMPTTSSGEHYGTREPKGEASPFPLMFELHVNMTIRQAFGHICTRLLQRMQVCRGIILYGGKQAKLNGVLWLYQAVSQLHTLILLCHALIPGEIRGEMDKEIRWLLKELDLAREWQVFLQGTLKPLMEQFNSYSGLETPLSKARDGQQLAVNRLGKALLSFRYTRLILGLAKWVEGRSWEFWSDPAQREGMAMPVTNFATEMLQRYHSQLRKRGQKFSSMDLSSRCGLLNNVEFMTHTTHLFAELFKNKRMPCFQTCLAELRHTMHGLVDLHTSNRFFARLIDKRQETVGHIIKGWQGARTDRRLADSTKEWQQFSNESTFW